MSFLAGIGLLHTVSLIFSILLFLQILVLMFNLQTLARENLVGELYAFLDEYWGWAHLKNNLFTLSVWVSSLLGCLYSIYALVGADDISIVDSWSGHPVFTAYIFLSLVFFTVYGVFRAVEQVKQTQETIAQLKKLKMFNWFRRTLENIKQSSWLNAGMGQVPKIIVAGSHWLTENISSHMIDKQLQQAAAKFFFIAALESMFRLATVAIALWVVSGRYLF